MPLMWAPPPVYCVLLAYCCCRYRCGQLVEVNAHSLFSKYFSESGKLVSRLFGKITELVEDEGSLVFVLIDEVESLTSARKVRGRREGGAAGAGDRAYVELQQGLRPALPGPGEWGRLVPALGRPAAVPVQGLPHAHRCSGGCLPAVHDLRPGRSTTQLCCNRDVPSPCRNSTDTRTWVRTSAASSQQPPSALLPVACLVGQRGCASASRPARPRTAPTGRRERI